MRQDMISYQDYLRLRARIARMESITGRPSRVKFTLLGNGRVRVTRPDSTALPGQYVQLSLLPGVDKC